MPKPIEAWWAQRQWSKGSEVPYAVGQFRAEWERYPVLARQYHPDLNHGITLSQVPPAAEVYLVWECDVGHRFVATPWEQRMRPNGSRRRSTWCPECAALARPRPWPVLAVPPPDATAPRMTAPAETETTTAAPAKTPPIKSPPARRLCPKSDAAARAPGEAFLSACAPERASAAEGELHHRLAARLELGAHANAVRVSRPFFEHLEVWPDIVLPDLRVAIEYDTTGRDGLEHVGKRESTDLRKDRALRSVAWEVVRVRCGKLRPLGPFDVEASGVSERTVDAVLDRLRRIRGALIVDSYSR